MQFPISQNTPTVFALLWSGTDSLRNVKANNSKNFGLDLN